MRKTHLALVVVALFLAVAGLATAVAASPIKSDEEIIMFPVSGARQAGGSWKIPVHIWVYEPSGVAATNPLDSTIVSTIAQNFGLGDIAEGSTTFIERAKWFVVDSERHKQVTVELDGQSFELAETLSNGHNITEVSYRGAVEDGARRLLNASLPEGDTRRFEGEVQFIPPTGVSVISDIDDTIKISNVLDKQALLRATFLEQHRVAAGMPPLYAELHAKGMFFHYVSASPWQLWPSLQPFIAKNYPKGTISLRNFRVKDSTVLEFLLKPSSDFKLQTITAIFGRYPGHRFILIGDSGECDPEVYGKVFRRFPDRVQRILIRGVTGSDFSNTRLEAAFNDVPEQIWDVIEGQSTIGDKGCTG